MEFEEVDPIELGESEQWDELDAQVELAEEYEEGGNWARQNPERVPPKFQELTFPNLLEGHGKLILSSCNVGSPCDRVKSIRERDKIWARELVSDVADACSLCWASARTEGFPDDLDHAKVHMMWLLEHGVVESKQLADAFWIHQLHGEGSVNTPEDTMVLGMWRKLNATDNRPAPMGSNPTTPVAGPLDEDGLPTIEIVDETFEISKSEGYMRDENGDIKWYLLSSNGRIESIRVSNRMPKGSTLRDLFWFKFIEGKSRKFWVGEGNTERALFVLVQTLDPKPTGKLTLKSGKVTIKVSPNPKAPALITVPAAELLRVLAGLTDRWGNLRDEQLAESYRLALKLHGAKEIPDWASKLNPRMDEVLGRLITCIRGNVEDLHLEVWGAVVGAWRELLGIPPTPPSPGNQLPGFTLTCRQCGKSAGTLYADGLCHACHRSANPL